MITEVLLKPRVCKAIQYGPDADPDELHDLSAGFIKPLPGGGHSARMDEGEWVLQEGEWIIHDGNRIWVMTDSMFSRYYREWTFKIQRGGSVRKVYVDVAHKMTVTRDERDDA